jgi:hypothetical protein
LGRAGLSSLKLVAAPTALDSGCNCIVIALKASIESGFFAEPEKIRATFCERIGRPAIIRELGPSYDDHLYPQIDLFIEAVH